MKSKIIHIVVLVGFLITTHIQASFTEKLKKCDGLLICGGCLMLGLIGGTMYPLWKKNKTEKPLAENKKLDSKESEELRSFKEKAKDLVVQPHEGNYLIKNYPGKLKPIGEIYNKCSSKIGIHKDCVPLEQFINNS